MATANERQHGGDHYKGTDYEHWDWVNDVKLGYLVGNATKYVFRWRRKNGLEDLEKAIHYVEKCKEVSAVGATSMHRYGDFWRLVTANNLYMQDAMALWYVMEGQFDKTLEILHGFKDAIANNGTPPS
jgi:hypothetical protein